MLIAVCEVKQTPKDEAALKKAATLLDSFFITRLLQQLGVMKTKALMYAESPFGDLDMIMLAGLTDVCKALQGNGHGALARSVACTTAAVLPDSLFAHKMGRKDKDGNFSAHYLAMEATLIHAQYTVMETEVDPKTSIAIGVALAKLIDCFNSRNSPSVLDAMRCIAQKGIVLMPRNVPLLTTLGLSQLAEYDRTFSSACAPGTTQFVQASKTLDDAEASFKAAIAMENQALSGDAPELVTNQSWWAAKQKANGAGGKAAVGKAPKGGKDAGAKAKGRQPAGRAARGGATSTATRNNSSSTPAPRAGRRAVAGSKPADTAKKAAGSTASRPVAGRRSQPAATPARTTAAKSKTPAPTSKAPIAGRRASAKGGRTPAGTDAPKAGTAKDAGKKPDASGSDTPASKPAPGEPVNGDAHDARLGLARVYNRRMADGVGKGLKVGSLSVEAETMTDQMVELYHAVIAARPELHDAIIELGEFQATTDPLGAVDTYCKFPFKDPPTFDDAYIHGEILRFLMKKKKYDDERLERSLIGYGLLGLCHICRRRCRRPSPPPSLSNHTPCHPSRVGVPPDQAPMRVGSCCGTAYSPLPPQFRQGQRHQPARQGDQNSGRAVQILQNADA